MTSPMIVRARGRSRWTRIVALLAVSVLAAPAMPAAAAPDPGPAAAQPASGGPALVPAAAGQIDGTRVTLITGDVIVYRERNGEPTFSVEEAPRDGGPSVFFQGEGDADNFYVYPSDVEGHIGLGVLDRELFNIPGLIRQGLDDQATGGQLPVLVTFAGDRSPQELARDANALPAASHARAAEAVQGAGVKVDREQAHRFRDAVLRRPVPGAAPQLARGVERVRLDRVLEIDLDESVPQIGAPAAWDAGFTGEGVTVAVLDTGVDAGHPDLAGQVVAEANFTEEPDPADGHGHGTHVASTIVGTGAASGGQYTGVAPDADLLSGKVCNAEGQCQESAIIAGMQWATSQGADIVNLSLGGDPTDGTDPLSQTLNQLSADTLFVVSAGNSGTSYSVGSPGSADAALTVAAVDKTDRRAWFSSQGPRVGDFAVKPNITAPGVDIVAARAAGTSLGSPVDDRYTALNGTSMSAPHVAGAAALLVQAKPDLSASVLKDALASTSADVGQSVWWAGTGRVDVAAALTSEVYGPASADFGSLTDQPAQREVVYTNRGETPIALDLAATLETWRGDPADGLTLAAGTVTVPAHGQASVVATANPEASGQGVFEGLITATADGVVLRTAVGFGVDAGTHTVTIQVLDSQGNPYRPPTASGSSQQVWLVNDTFEPGTGVGEKVQLFLIGEDGVATGRVRSGTYTVIGTPSEFDEETGERTRASMLVEVETKIDTDTTIVLDSRDAVKLEVSVPRETEIRTHTIALSRPGISLIGSPNGRFPMYVTPTPAGQLQPISLFTQFTLTQPQSLHPVAIYNFAFGNHNRLYSEAPGYAYHLPFSYENGVPDDLHHTVKRRDLVEVPMRYHADAADVFVERRFDSYPPFEGSLLFQSFVTRPGVVTEYFLADDQITWRNVVTLHTRLDAAAPGSINMFSPDRYLDSEGGTKRDEERWFDAPLRYGAVDVRDQVFASALPTSEFVLPPSAAFVRGGADGDQFLPGFWLMDNSHGHGGISIGAGAFGSWRMWNLDAGTELEPSGLLPAFSLAPGEATYRLEKTWDYPDFVGGLFHAKPASTTVWEFQSTTPTDVAPLPGYRCPFAGLGCEFQPVIQLSYDFGQDVYNRVPAGRANVIIVEAGSHSKTPGRSPVTDISVEYSTDGGDTWTDARLLGNITNGTARVLIQHPKLADTDGFVALRVKAEDADGNSVEQTIERAYILR